jgi:L-lactate transport
MWQHNYTPLANNLALSSLAAALPIFVLLVMLGVARKPAWIAALSGLAAAIVVSLFIYRMPPSHTFSAIAYGAAQGLFPIGWVVFSAILLYNIVVKTGKFEIVKNSMGNLSGDRRLQALLIAFAFGAFIEGAAGFGTSVAVAAAMLTGLGFAPFYAGGICLLANTVPVTFGSLGIPITTLQRVTGLPLQDLSAGVGSICGPVAVIVPAYLVLMMGGWRALRGVLPAALLAGVVFGGTQFLIAAYSGPELAALLASLATLGSLVLLIKVWKPKDRFHMAGDGPARAMTVIPAGEAFLAWSPFILLVVCVLVSGLVKKHFPEVMSRFSITFMWPALHNLVMKMPPVVQKPTLYDAPYPFDWLSAAGTSCLIAAILSAMVLRMSVGTFFSVLKATAYQLKFAEATIATTLGLAFLMNYSGETATLGLTFAATGAAFPFFSAFLGWLGVFVTGSDTSANALFGNLQVVTAQHLHMSPTLMASANSSGGVMGKMISPQSIAVASAATAMAAGEESRLFRFTLRHSILLAAVVGLVVLFYAYTGLVG